MLPEEPQEKKHFKDTEDRKGDTGGKSFSVVVKEETRLQCVQNTDSDFKKRVSRREKMKRS